MFDEVGADVMGVLRAALVGGESIECVGVGGGRREGGRNQHGWLATRGGGRQVG